jgi:hypothetical protein
MVWIADRNGEPISEYGRRFLESNTVFSFILTSLLDVPLKLKHISLGSRWA